MKHHSFLVLSLVGFYALAAGLILNNAEAAFWSSDKDKSHTIIRIDGSSTVYPISEAMAEEFQGSSPGIRVTVGVSGTGGGFKKFCIGETDISDASRPIKSKEQKLARSNGIDYIELPIAFDGVSVLTNPKNRFVDYLTVAELHQIWKPDSTVKKWSDVRPEWPDRPIHLYGPGTDSGTFDYFTEVVNGKAQVCRSDYTASADPNILVYGIAGDENGLGFFGYAYYAENRSKLRLVSIDGGSGPVAPSPKTINNGSYQPLSRPIFIYVSAQSLRRSEVNKFVHFYLNRAPDLVSETGYVALPESTYKLGLTRIDKRITGSVFSGVKTAGLTISELMSLEE